MALRRNAPDKVKLKLRGDGRPLGDLGNDLLPRDREHPGSGGALIRDEQGRAFLDWSGGSAAAFAHPDPATAEAVGSAAADRLAELDPDAHARLTDLTGRLADGLAGLGPDLPEALLPRVRSAPGMVFVTFSAGADTFDAFRQAMLKRGLWLPLAPDAPWQITLAHDAAAVDRSVLAAGDALGEIG